ncbi:MAG: endolytic transglycosylase MltG, partial [Candidatus Moranbacteria bacterium]|nr:endolytic transglycosylase MltG [Candidatus Moranbacteria bacterium]
MLSSKRLYIAIGLFFILVLLEFYSFNRQASFSHGLGDAPQTIEIKEGEGVQEIGQKLADTQIVKSKYYFDYYIWKTGSKGKIQAGKYELKGTMTIPEIVQVLSLGEIVSNEVKITFPEGISAKKMADILKQKGLDGDGFLSKSDCGCGVRTDYGFLKDKPEGANLEGFLFPDTYIFFKDAGTLSIINRMLQNFDEKITSKMRGDIQNQGKSIFEIVTMASILEKEVKTTDDMKIASGIFWDRIGVGMPLQS